MDYRIDQQALGTIAGLAVQLPTLHAPVPPDLAALEQRLGLLPAGQSLGVPFGCHTSIPPDLLRRLLSMVLPPIPLLNGMPMIGVLANLRFLVAVRLRFPIPGSLHLLASLMEQLDLRALSLIARMPWGALNGLHMLVHIGALLRLRLNIHPAQAGASLAIQGNLPRTLPAFGMPLPPPYLTPSLIAILRYLLQVRMLLALCQTMGVDLTMPGAIPRFSAQLRMLLGVRLPVLAVMPSLLPNLYLVARINALWPIANIVADLPTFRAYIAAILRLQVPPMPSCLGPAQLMNLANAPPPLPTVETIEQVLGTDLAALSKIDWKIPDTLPIEPAMPGLNALACLQEIGPVLVPSSSPLPGLVPPALPPLPGGLPPLTALPGF